MISSTRLLPSLAVCLWSLLAVDAFSVPLRNGNSVGGWTSQRLQQQQQPWTCFMTAAASNDDTDADADADDSNVDTEPVVEDAAAVKEETTQEEEEVAVQEPEEDPELTALKEQIAQLEKDLKHKRQQVALTVDRADEFTDAGYARKVAEMEQMQRTRRVSSVLFCSVWHAFLCFELMPMPIHLSRIFAHTHIYIYIYITPFFQHTDATIVRRQQCYGQSLDGILARVGQVDGPAHPPQRGRLWQAVQCLAGCHYIQL